MWDERKQGLAVEGGGVGIGSSNLWSGAESPEGGVSDRVARTMCEVTRWETCAGSM